MFCLNFLTYKTTLNFVFNSMIDRLWLKYQKDKIEISIGRQRVNWGVNTIWNNNDLFNAYNFIDFDYIERPGSDVVRFIYTGDNLSSFELVYMPNERKGYALAGLYKLNSFGYDFQLLAANYFNDIVLIKSQIDSIIIKNKTSI